MTLTSNGVASIYPTTASVGVNARQMGQQERSDTLQARNTRIQLGENIKVTVRRSEPNGSGGTYQHFTVPYQKSMRVLDALNWIAEQPG